MIKNCIVPLVPKITHNLLPERHSETNCDFVELKVIPKGRIRRTWLQKKCDQIGGKVGSDSEAQWQLLLDR